MIKISDAEFEVLKILWKRNESTSIDIIQELRDKKSWSENTIRTLITRLQNKKAIEIVNKERKNIYI